MNFRRLSINSSLNDGGRRSRFDNDGPDFPSPLVSEGEAGVDMQASILAQDLSVLRREIALGTVRAALSSRLIGQAEAQPFYAAWMDEEGWNSEDRDPLVPIARREGDGWHRRITQIAERLRVKDQAVPMFDLADVLPCADLSALTVGQAELIRGAAVVAVWVEEKRRSLIIASINPVAADLTVAALAKYPNADGYRPMAFTRRVDHACWRKKLDLQAHKE